jgi:hypothetical protein
MASQLPARASGTGGKMRRLLLGLSGVALVGCTEYEVPPAVFQRAAHEFDCPEDVVRAENIGGTTYVARGCGQRATYTCHAANVGTYREEEVCIRESVEQDPESAPTEAPPRPPPGLREPQSNAPIGVAGLSFGQSSAAAGQLCEKAGLEWEPAETDHFTCSGPAEDVGFPVTLLTRFCDDALCAVVLIATEPDPGVWPKLLARLQKALGAKYGEPSETDVAIPKSCEGAGLPVCVQQDKAYAQVNWKWRKGTKIELSLGKGPGGGGGPAVRILYAQPSAVAPAQGL